MKTGPIQNAHVMSWILAGGALCCALAWASSAAADGSSLFRFGMAGIAAGQTARLNVAFSPPPDEGRPCRLVLGYVDAVGMVIISRAVTLTGGRSAFLELAWRDVAFRTEPRVQIRPVLQPPPDDGRPLTCEGLTANLEVYNTLTGRTQFLYTPPPDDGQPPPDDGHVTVGFVDAGGMPLLTRSGAPIVADFALRSGESAFLELHSQDIAFGGLRTQIRPVLSPPPDDGRPVAEALRGIVATLEIYDPLTGRTQYLYGPPPDDGLPADTFAPVGFGLGQTARLNVVLMPPPDDGQPAQLRRLGRLANTLGRLGTNIQGINANFNPPPDDGKPTYRAILGDIRDGGQVLIDQANEIEAKLR